jgi:hypothetical protein
MYNNLESSHFKDLVSLINVSFISNNGTHRIGFSTYRWDYNSGNYLDINEVLSEDLNHTLNIFNALAWLGLPSIVAL